MSESFIVKEVVTLAEIIDAIRIRVDVFILEQGCPPGWEPDELDSDSRHFIIVHENTIVGTLRVRNTGHSEFKIERMAIKNSHRKFGYGKKLVEFVLNKLSEESDDSYKFWLESQKQAAGFYKKMGFIATSEEYDLWGLGILHVTMRLPCVA